MATKLTAREYELTRIFERFIFDLFDHDSARPDATLVERVVLHGYDAMEASALLAQSEFGAELASDLCQRAVLLRHKAIELTQFLCAEQWEEIQELPTVKSMAYSAELREKHPELYRNPGKQAAPQKECVHNAHIPPTEPKQSSAIRTNTAATASNKRDAWAILSDLESLVSDAQHHAAGLNANAHDADSGEYEPEALSALLANDFREFSTSIYAAQLEIKSLYSWFRENGIESDSTLGVREIIARGREIREEQAKAAINIQLHDSQRPAAAEADPS